MVFVKVSPSLFYQRHIHLGEKDAVLYLWRMLGLAEERGFGSEESEVLAFFVQAAVPAAHAVTAGHGGGQHRTDGHGEVFQDT